MGKELYDSSPLAKELFEKANDLLGFRITDTMFNGTEDELIPIELGRRSKTYLESAGVKPVYREYPAGHTISTECLQEMLQWLDGLSDK